MCIAGAVTAFGGMPDFISGYGKMPGWIGFVSLCVSVLFIAIAVLVPVLTLRKKKEAVVAKEAEVARDRVGIRPLLYSQTREGLAFASEAKSLFAGDWEQAVLKCWEEGDRVRTEPVK